jgi:hypothetical protein
LFFTCWDLHGIFLPPPLNDCIYKMMKAAVP